MVLDILNGISPGDIDVVNKSPNQFIFDYRVMKKIGMTGNPLPEGALVINKPIVRSEIAATIRSVINSG